MRRCSLCGRPGHRARRRNGGLTCPYTQRQFPAHPESPAHHEPVSREIETRVFDSIADLVEACRQPAHPNSAHAHADSVEWVSVGATHNQAVAMLAGEGCPELAERVRKLAFEMLPQVRPTPNLGQAYDVSGSIVDVERFLAGDPECMLDFASPAGERKTLHVTVHVGCSSSTEVETINARGAAICAMIDALEASGTRVRLDWICYKANPGISYSGLLKDYHAPLDLDLVAFMFAHPAVNRQLVCRLMSQSTKPAIVRSCRSSGFGYTSDAPWLEGLYLPALSNQNLSRWLTRPMIEIVQDLFNGGTL